MEHEVVWNGTIGRTQGVLLCGAWEQRRDNPWTVLHAPDNESYPNLRRIFTPRGRGLLARVCPQCQRTYPPRLRKQKYCSPQCARQAPKAAAFTAQIGGRRHAP